MSRAALLLLCSTSLMGCIITREPSIDPPPRIPATVLGTPQSPMNAVLAARLDRPSGGDGGVAREIEFVAQVRDPNLRQNLIGLAFVDYHPDNPINLVRDEVFIPAEQDEDPLNREVRFQIDNAEFGGVGCHTVELHVAERFEGFEQIRPVPADDLGVGVWWVAATDSSVEDVDMTSCETWQP